MQDAPRVVVTFELESTPRVRCDFANDAAERRMVLWLETHPTYLALLHQAIALEAEAQTA